MSANVMPGPSSVAVAYARSKPAIMALVASNRVLQRLMDPGRSLSGTFLVLRASAMRSQQIPVVGFDLETFAFADDALEAQQLLETVISEFVPSDRRRSTYHVDWLDRTVVFGIYGYQGGMEDVFPFTTNISKPFSYVRFSCTVGEYTVE